MSDFFPKRWPSGIELLPLSTRQQMPLPGVQHHGSNSAACGHDFHMDSRVDFQRLHGFLADVRGILFRFFQDATTSISSGVSRLCSSSLSPKKSIKSPQNRQQHRKHLDRRLRRWHCATTQWGHETAAALEWLESFGWCGLKIWRFEDKMIYVWYIYICDIYVIYMWYICDMWYLVWYDVVWYL